jgi:hypothetical protein
MVRHRRKTRNTRKTPNPATPTTVGGTLMNPRIDDVRLPWNGNEKPWWNETPWRISSEG